MAVLLGAGCGAVATPEPGPPPQSEKPPEKKKERPSIVIGPPVPRVIEPYRIKPLDILEVSVLGENEMTKRTVVGPDGRLSYFVAHDVIASGRTFAEIRAVIREKLKEYFIDPQVSVIGMEFAGNTVSILGQVRRPGAFVIGSDTRLLDLIAMAGGIGVGGWYPSYAGTTQIPTEFADLDSAFVLRVGRFLDVDFRALLSGDEYLCARNNVILMANDTVYIPSAVSLENKVYVLGEVRNPRVIWYWKEITLLETIAECGGLPVGARYRSALVVRGSLKDPRVIKTDLDALRTGSARNFMLEPGDIVYVPKTALKNFNEIASLILPGIQAAEATDRIILRH